jgi:hypothetical protein
VTGVGSLIHLFAFGYMKEDEGLARFFAYLNLFISFMLVLVLGASMPVMFVGWEGVGLCSYLLIGFWYTDSANADAGKKAFIMNRIGDFGFLIAMYRRHRPPLPTAVRRSRPSRSSCSSAAPASRPRFRSTPGCPTPWPARRRCRH